MPCEAGRRKGELAAVVGLAAVARGAIVTTVLQAYRDQRSHTVRGSSDQRSHSTTVSLLSQAARGQGIHSDNSVAGGLGPGESF